MCTVSYISGNFGSILTSNRDEHSSRPTASRPGEELINNYKVIYPRDPKAGGTWFAVREDGVVIVLLNGAFQKHIRRNDYTMSRGLVLLKVIGGNKPEAEFFTLDLTQIEPFTLVLYDGHSLLETRWDGTYKHKKELNTWGNYIWSSATLYTNEVAREREQLFETFLEKKHWINENSIIDFHLNNYNDFENGFVIDRENGLQTVSITQAVINDREIRFSHYDLKKRKEKANPSCVKLYI